MVQEEKLFDLSFLEELDDRDFLVQMVSLYLKETPKDFAMLEKAVNSTGQGVVVKSAHKLKSSTGMIRAGKLFAILDRTEQAARSGEVPAELKKQVIEAREAFELLKVALQKHLDAMITAS